MRKYCTILFLISGSYLMAQSSITLDKNSFIQKVWSFNGNTYMHLDVKHNSYPSGFEQQGYLVPGEKVTFFKINGKGDIKEVMFDTYDNYTVNFTMKKVFFYCNNYAFLFIEEDIVAFDLESEKVIEIQKKGKYNSLIGNVNLFYDQKSNKIRIFMAKSVLAEMVYDVATETWEYFEHAVSTNKLESVIAYYDKKVLVNFSNDGAKGWAVGDLETEEMAALSFPDKFEKFTSTHFFQMPNSPIVYMRIIGVVVGVFYTDRSYLYRIDMDNMTFTKVGDDGGYLWDSEVLINDCIIIDNSTTSETYIVKDGTMKKSDEMWLRDIFYHEGEFYYYRNVRKNSSGKPTLYKFDASNESWSEVKTFDVKQKLNLTSYLLMDEGGYSSLFMVDNKTSIDISLTPPLF